MHRRLQADISIAVCSLLWGATFVVVQKGLADSSVFVFLALRFTLAALVMAAVYRSELRRLTVADFSAGGVTGAFLMGGFTAQTAALLYTTPSKAAFITGFGVVLVPVLLSVFWRRRISAWVWLGSLVSLTGLYYLTVPSSGIRELNRGDVLALLCALLFAFQIIFIAKYKPYHTTGALSFLQVAFAAVVSLVAVPFLAVTHWELPRVQVTRGLVFAVVVTAILATALAFSVEVWAQQYTTATHTALLLSLEPVFAALTSYIVVHERLGRRVLLGAALILAGIAVAELKGPAELAREDVSQKNSTAVE